MKVLVLHGCCQSGDAIKGYLKSNVLKFGLKAGLEFFFLDAPFAHPDGGLTWTDPPLQVDQIWRGENAFEATPGIEADYACLETAFSLVSQTILENDIEALLGFSQGSFVAYEFMRAQVGDQVPGWGGDRVPGAEEARGRIRHVVAVAGYPFLTPDYPELPCHLLNVVHPCDAVVPASLAYPSALTVSRLEHNNKELTESSREAHVLPSRAGHSRAIVHFLLNGSLPE